jgi:CRISPR-associated exonuclease Cas4
MARFVSRWKIAWKDGYPESASSVWITMIKRGCSILNSDQAHESNPMHITGTMVAYYYICHRKLWLFAKGLNFENISGNTDVIKGKVLHEQRFQKENSREIGFNSVQIDFLRFGEEVFVHEIKKSNKFDEAHRWQIKYYIFTLQNQGINCNSGVIHYPSSMRKVDIDMEENDRELIETALQAVSDVLMQPQPPKKLTKKVCARCAYYDFCFA